MMGIGKWIISVLGGSIFAAIISLLYCFPLWVIALPVTIPLYYIIFSEHIEFTSFMQMCLVGLGILSYVSMWWNCVKGMKEDKDADEILVSTFVIFIIVGILSVLALICIFSLPIAAILWGVLLFVFAIFGAMLDFDFVDFLSSQFVLLLIWGMVALFGLLFLYEVFFGDNFSSNYSSGYSNSYIEDKQKERSNSTRKALFHMVLGAGLFYFFTRDKRR